MNRSLKILIIGGGVGGMATAIAFARYGIQADLVDIDPHWKVLGAGITITGPTLRAFKTLGVIDEVAAEGSFSATVGLYTQTGNLIVEHTMPPLVADLPATGGILRPVLHRILSTHTLRVGTQVRLGLTVAGFAQSDAGVEVAFSDGSSGHYDLVVGADGVNSGVRDMLFPDAPKPELTGQGCWRVLADRPPGVKGAQMYYGKDSKAGITPCSPDKVYMFLNNTMLGNPWVDPVEGIEQLRAHLAGFGGAIATVREGLGPDSAFNYRPLAALLLQRPWSVGRVGLIGDACHATTPHLASGAGITVEDALVLAEEMMAASSVEEGWQRFEARRWERCSMVVKTSVRLGAMEIAQEEGNEQAKVFGEAMAALMQTI